MNPFELLQRQITRLGDAVAAQPTWRDARVTSVSPLRITYDGASDPLVDAPEALCPVLPGDHVRTVKIGRRVTIVGVIGGGGWRDYTPSWVGLTLGNAVTSARYSIDAGMVAVTLAVLLGTTSAVTGGISVSLPVAARSGTTATGGGWSQPTGSGSYYPMVAFHSSSTTLVAVRTVGTTLDSTGPTLPAAWAPGGMLRLTLTYEAG